VGSKVKVVEHVDDIASVVLVLLLEVLQDPDLLLRLPVEPFLISNHFESYMLMGLVVVDLEDLAEGALADDLEDLVPICYVVVWYVRIRTLIVVVAAVVWSPDIARPLLGVRADKVDLWIVEYLVVLVRREFVHVQFHYLFWCCNHCLWFEGAGGTVLLLRRFVLWTLRCPT